MLRPVDSQLPYPDAGKLLQFGAFALLVLPCSLLRPRSFVWIIPFALIFAGVIEAVQPQIGREREFLGFLVGILGVGFGMALGLGLRQITSFRV